MTRWVGLLVALSLAATSLSSTSALAGDDVDQAPGFVVVQIDGLSEPMLRTAVEAGAMPYLESLIDDGSHSLGSWHTTAASNTVVTQAGLLHGHWREIPGYRWWDRDAGALVGPFHREQGPLLEARISGSGDLLADGGASITNLFSGGAPRVVLTATDLGGPALLRQVARYLVDVPMAALVVMGFLEGARSDVERAVRGEAAPSSSDIERTASIPVIGPALEWALADVTRAAVLRELERGTPLVYATLATYDRVSHHAGPDHPAAVDALTHIDRALASIGAAADRASRPYRVVFLSDHGQTKGASFERRSGETLTDVVAGLLSSTASDDLVVAASGNLAHVYLQPYGERLDADEIEALHPGLIAGLVAHPGIGVVVVRESGGRSLAFGPEGEHQLSRGRTDAGDPFGHYGVTASESLLNIASPEDAGDLVVISAYDPIADEVAPFEPQLGSHGGIGGAQTRPFILYPDDLEPGGEPLTLVGLDALRATIDGWLEHDAMPAVSSEPPPHLGEEVCVTAEVSGARGELCAHRDRFGAAWTLGLTDTEADGRPVTATVELDIDDGPDEEVRFELDDEGAPAFREDGVFSPRIGSAIGDISITTCVTRRFWPDRCRTSSAPLPQLTPQASPAQAERLEQLVFEEPLSSFMATWEQAEHSGIDAGFEWSSNGCSAGPFAELFDERLYDACVRHDFAYRNFGERFFDPRDSVRIRVEEQLAADAAAMGEQRLAQGLEQTMRRFGGPAFYGEDLAALWGVPESISSWLAVEESEPGSQ